MPAIVPAIIEIGIAIHTEKPTDISLAVITAPKVNEPSPVKSGNFIQRKAIATPKVKKENANP